MYHTYSDIKANQTSDIFVIKKKPQKANYAKYGQTKKRV